MYHVNSSLCVWWWLCWSILMVLIPFLSVTFFSKLILVTWGCKLFGEWKQVDLQVVPVCGVESKQ